MFNGDATAAEQKGTEERAEHAEVTKGQREINKIWEYTQAFIAIVVVAANIVAGIHVALYHETGNMEIPSVLKDTLLMVIVFYFTRTNTHKIGGVGDKPTDRAPYVGR